jgi:hypothetical protein
LVKQNKTTMGCGTSTPSPTGTARPPQADEDLRVEPIAPEAEQSATLEAATYEQIGMGKDVDTSLAKQPSVINLTEYQRELIVSGWSSKTITEHCFEEFYQTLFAEYPQLAPLFRNDIKVQGNESRFSFHQPGYCTVS